MTIQSEDLQLELCELKSDPMLLTKKLKTLILSERWFVKRFYTKDVLMFGSTYISDKARSF